MEFTGKNCWCSTTKQRIVISRAVNVHFRLEVSPVDAGCCIAGKRKEERE